MTALYLYPLAAVNALAQPTVEEPKDQQLVEQGQQLMSQGRLDEARLVFERAREQRRPALCPKAEIGLGQLAILTQSWHKAISHLEAAQRATRRKIWAPSKQEESEVFDLLAVATRYQGQKGALSKASKLEEEALELDPENLTARYNLARLLAVQGKPNEVSWQLYLLAIKADAQDQLEDYADSMIEDPDFAAYRETAAFKDLADFIGEKITHPRPSQQL